MKAIIIHHTRFGNTERIAKSLEMGKEAAGIQDIVCITVADVIAADSLKEYDIICMVLQPRDSLCSNQ